MFAPKIVVSAVFGAIWPSGPCLFHPRLEALDGVAGLAFRAEVRKLFRV
jgi:hypothetical protein